jgi:primase-polymerase (primpol)-like protein
VAANPDLGIGFVFAANGDMVGVDVDECLDAAGKLKAWAVPIIEKFAFTYMEVLLRCWR